MTFRIPLVRRNVSKVDSLNLPSDWDDANDTANSDASSPYVRKRMEETIEVPSSSSETEKLSAHWIHGLLGLAQVNKH